MFTACFTGDKYYLKNSHSWKIQNGVRMLWCLFWFPKACSTHAIIPTLTLFHSTLFTNVFYQKHSPNSWLRLEMKENLSWKRKWAILKMWQQEDRFKYWECSLARLVQIGPASLRISSRDARAVSLVHTWNFFSSTWFPWSGRSPKRGRGIMKAQK